MSILIKMPMPKNCGDCLFIDYFKGQWYCHCLNDLLETGSNKRDVRCPLIELPPHGLIDKQMLLRNIADNQFNNSSVGHEEDYAFWGKVWDYIFDAPTIIEAEGEE